MASMAGGERVGDRTSAQCLRPACVGPGQGRNVGFSPVAMGSIRGLKEGSELLLRGVLGGCLWPRTRNGLREQEWEGWDFTLTDTDRVITARGSPSMKALISLPHLSRPFLVQCPCLGTEEAIKTVSLSKKSKG